VPFVRDAQDDVAETFGEALGCCLSGGQDGVAIDFELDDVLREVVPGDLFLEAQPRVPISNGERIPVVLRLGQRAALVEVLYEGLRVDRHTFSTHPSLSVERPAPLNRLRNDSI
jgi:hypothetical protein